MMDLFPVAADFSEYSACPNLECDFISAKSEIAPLPAYGIKHLRCLVDCIIKIFYIDFRRAIKNIFIDRLYLCPASFDAPSGLAIAVTSDYAQFSAIIFISPELKAQ